MRIFCIYEISLYVVRGLSKEEVTKGNKMVCHFKPKKMTLCKQIYINTQQKFYLFKVNNRNTKKRCEIRLKLTIKITERHQPYASTLNIYVTLSSSVSILNFEHVGGGI